MSFSVSFTSERVWIGGYAVLCSLNFDCAGEQANLCLVCGVGQVYMLHLRGKVHDRTHDRTVFFIQSDRTHRVDSQLFILVPFARIFYGCCHQNQFLACFPIHGMLQQQELVSFRRSFSKTGPCLKKTFTVQIQTSCHRQSFEPGRVVWHPSRECLMSSVECDGERFL